MKKYGALNKKTLIIGLDGASWKIIDPLIEKGKLPNLKYLIENGSYGPLLSTETMISPSVWTSIMTGKLPQHHGILDFMTMQNKLKAKRIWEIFESYGKTVGIAGFLMTWPPRLKNQGFLIPDHFAPDNSTIPEDVAFLRDLTSHRDLKKVADKLWTYFRKFRKYHISLFTLFKAFSILMEKKLLNRTYLDSFYKEINIFTFLMEKVFTTLSITYQPDLSAVYFPATDVVAHKYWCYYQPDDFDAIHKKDIRKYGNIIPETYIEVDKVVGRILKIFQKNFEGLNVIVVSDHGFQSCHESKYHPNTKMNFLLEKLTLNGSYNYTIIGHNTMVSYQQSDSDPIQQLRKLQDIIDGIKTVEKNIPIFETEIIEGYMKISAQPLWKGYQFEDDIDIDGATYKVEDVLERGVLLTGRHEKEGIFIMSGKDIKKNNYVTSAEVYDITPTILALNRMPVAKDMKGKVLKGVFENQFLEKSSIKNIETYGTPEDVIFSENELEKIKQNEDDLVTRLKNLGYME